MKQILLTLMLLSSAHASDWIRVGTTPKNEVFYVDKNSIKHKNNWYSTWVKVIAPNGNYYLDFMIFENDFVRITDVTCYKYGGIVAPWYSSWCNQIFDNNWSRIRPDSTTDKIYKWLKQHTSGF